MSTDSPDVSVNTTPDASGAIPPPRPHILVLISDLGASDRVAPVESVDAQTFNELLQRAQPTRALRVESPFGDDPYEFELKIDSIKGFAPDMLVRQAPAGSWRMGLREKIVERQTGKCSEADLKAACQSAAAAEPSLEWLLRLEAASNASTSSSDSAPETGGSILDMVDDPDDAARARAEIEKLAADAGDPNARVRGGEAGRLKNVLARLDRELGQIADAILHHPDVRALESAWRGLRLLVERIDFREGNRLWVVHSERDDAAINMIEKVIEPAFDGEIPTPNMILMDFSFGNTPVDIEALDYLAQHANGLPVPLVVPLTPAFFNAKSLRLIKNLPHFQSVIDGWEFAKYRALRDQPHAKSLVPIVGSFILRAPYQSGDGAAGFDYTESVAKITDLLWAGGHYAVGVCAARAFATHGWPTRMFGAEAGKLEDLPVVDNPNDPSQPWGPGDLMLPDRRMDELPEIGVNQLVSIKNKDQCMLLGGVSAKRPVKTQETSTQTAVVEISLPYQQFANIAGAWLVEQLPSLRGLPADQIQQKLLGGFMALLRLSAEDDQDCIQVGVGEHQEKPGASIVQVRVAPPQRIAPGGVFLDFNFAI